MSFFHDLDVRMRRAVQRESRSLSSSFSGGSSSNNKRKAKQQGRCCLLLILLSPIFLILLIIYVLQMYNVMVQYDEQQRAILKQTELEAHRQHQHYNVGDSEEQQREQQLLRKRQADVARLHARQQQQEEEDDEDKAEVEPSAAAEAAAILSVPPATLVLTTHLGRIRISLRPNLSQGSVEYIERLMESKEGCKRCNFYRAEKPGILQGIMMSNPDIPTNAVSGSCPPGAETVQNDCPAWDPNCDCHGPVMTRGSVGWAAGDPGGPDFFIDAYKRPATWWGTQHTNFGFIEEPASMALVDQILDLPVSTSNEMHYLKEPIHFEMSLER